MALIKNTIISAGSELSAIYPDDYISCIKREDTVISNAYHKIISQEGDKNQLKIQVGIFAAKDERLIKSTVHTFTPSVADEASNFIKQGYEYLKTLSEYADAVDG